MIASRLEVTNIVLTSVGVVIALFIAWWGVHTWRAQQRAAEEARAVNLRITSERGTVMGMDLFGRILNLGPLVSVRNIVLAFDSREPRRVMRSSWSPRDGVIPTGQVLRFSTPWPRNGTGCIRFEILLESEETFCGEWLDLGAQE